MSSASRHDHSWSSQSIHAGRTRYGRLAYRLRRSQFGRTCVRTGEHRSVTAWFRLSRWSIREAARMGQLSGVYRRSW